MDKILMTQKAQQQIQKVINGPAKLLLSYNDGVGPFSSVGSCSIGTDFDILAVVPNEKDDDYTAQLSSALGTIYYKGYSARYLDQDLKLSVGSFNQLQLSGQSGMIDGSVRIIDERGQNNG